MRRAPGWRRLVVLGDYRQQSVLREWLLAFKHGGRPQLAEPLAAQLALRLKGEDGVLVPVPLHPLRRLERGHDQAGLLARALARHSGLPWMKALRRLRATHVQGSPGARSRRANVRGAFAARRSAAGRLAERVVWLVDDVVTSGATAEECARVLRRAGARRVDVVALARATRDSSSEVG